MPNGVYKRLHSENCKVKNCNKKYHSLGYCYSHYSNNYRTGHPLGKFKGNKEARLEAFKKRKIWEINRIAFICKIKGCNKKHYSKSYCKKHLANLLYSGHPLGIKSGIMHKCIVKDCQNRTMNKYCNPHWYRVKHNFSLDLSIKYSPRGKRNFQWKGGITQYPNHYLMKKNRLIVLLHNPKCERCGKSATEIHHKDGNKSNHKLSNLMASCRKCNAQLRTRPNIRFLSIYGMTQKRIAERLKINLSQCVKLHLQNKLELLLKE